MVRTRFWKKKNETKILYLAHVNVTEPKEVLNIGFLSHFSFPKTLFYSFLHHHYLQFLYPTHFLVRECFSLLVSSIFNFIVDDICEYWQVLTSYSYDVASLLSDTETDDELQSWLKCDFCEKSFPSNRGWIMPYLRPL